jgi:hypothetical protein
MDAGRWKLEARKLKVESGSWRLDAGGWRLESEKLKVEN